MELPPEVVLRFPLHRHLLSSAGELQIDEHFVRLAAPYLQTILVVPLAQVAAAGMLEPTSLELWPMPQRYSILAANFGLVFTSPVPSPKWKISVDIRPFGRPRSQRNWTQLPGVALRIKDPTGALDALEVRGVHIDDDLPTTIERYGP